MNTPTRKATKMTTNHTKQAALEKLIAAGYDARITPSGIDVRGENWSAHYDDQGQDWNEYNGPVPPQVDALAVWDDATTRA